MASKFFQIFKPFVRVIPSINPPAQDLNTKTRLRNTLSIFVIYSILSSLPRLVGIQLVESDPFAFFRTITASNAGSLIELGIGPLLISGVLLYILTTFNLIEINKDDPNEKDLYNCTLKSLAMGFTVIGAVMLLVGGFFGSSLNPLEQIFFISQLTVIGVFIIYLDEFISKGWGIGSGVALFLLAGFSLQIFQGLFAIQAVGEGANEVTSARGIIPAFIFWATQEGPITAFFQLFFRYSPNPADNLNLPALSLLSLLSTIVFIFILNYIASIRIKTNNQEIIKETNNDSISTQFNIIQFLIIPVIVTSVLFSGLYFLSSIIWQSTGGGGTGTPDLLPNILGLFEWNRETNLFEPVSGLAYFLVPPRALFGSLGVFDLSKADLLELFLRTVIYSLVFIGITWFFLKRKFNSSESDYSRFNGNNDLFQIISTWGLLVLILIALANMVGVLGTGIGIYLCISLIREYITIIKTKKDPDIRILSFYI